MKNRTKYNMMMEDTAGFEISKSNYMKEEQSIKSRRKKTLISLGLSATPILGIIVGDVFSGAFGSDGIVVGAIISAVSLIAGWVGLVMSCFTCNTVMRVLRLMGKIIKSVARAPRLIIFTWIFFILWYACMAIPIAIIAGITVMVPVIPVGICALIQKNEDKQYLRKLKSFVAYDFEGEAVAA